MVKKSEIVGKDQVVMKFLSDLVVYTKYSNFLESENRRQTWEECVDVVKNMHKKKYPQLEKEIDRVYEQYVKPKKVLPSMRSIQFGGLPIEIAENRVYNCAYIAVDHPAVFHETLFNLLCGTGVGYSVCSRDTKKLPTILDLSGTPRYRHKVGDSIEGWADSLKELIYAYMAGDRPAPRFDYRDVRPEGSLIKKTGGRAPGHEKLQSTHIKVESVLKGAAGRKLRPVEVHDIMCYIADCVLSGGIREAAMISLFDKSDKEMMNCKSSTIEVSDWELLEERDTGATVKYKLKDQPYYGLDDDGYGRTTISFQYGTWDYDNLKNNNVLPWYVIHPQRARSNNSVKLNRHTTTKDEFMEIWQATKDSNSGEPGILWVYDDNMGTNPCAEISLSGKGQFCNLTSVNVYDVDDQQELNDRVRAAAFIGTLQAGYTDFHYLRPQWKETTEREALLGVSMTGIASGKVLDLDIQQASAAAVDTNRLVADIIGINPAARVTCIKPEGSGTLAAGVMGSGIHAIHSEYYIRNNRIKKSHPIYGYLMEIMPQLVEDDYMDPENRAVVSMPMKAPEGSITRSESAIDMLQRIKRFSDQWVKPGHQCAINDTHNVSATVSIGDGEWDEVCEWMWDNKSSYNGLSVLPYYGGTYRQAPFIEIDEEAYLDMLSKFPSNFDFSSIVETFFDTNHASDNVACQGGACEI
jgi:ribonucleoside-diphosphate reductase alpha chain